MLYLLGCIINEAVASLFLYTWIVFSWPWPEETKHWHHRKFHLSIVAMETISLTAGKEINKAATYSTQNESPLSTLCGIRHHLSTLHITIQKTPEVWKDVHAFGASYLNTIYHKQIKLIKWRKWVNWNLMCFGVSKGGLYSVEALGWLWLRRWNIEKWGDWELLLALPMWVVFRVIPKLLFPHKHNFVIHFYNRIVFLLH